MSSRETVTTRSRSPFFLSVFTSRVMSRMAEYTDGIERINIELSIKNKLQLVEELHAYFTSGNLEVTKADDATGEGVSKEEILDLLAFIDDDCVPAPDWLAAFGSRGFYSTMTIDQSAKWVTVERLGPTDRGVDAAEPGSRGETDVPPSAGE